MPTDPTINLRVERGAIVIVGWIDAGNFHVDVGAHQGTFHAYRQEQKGDMQTVQLSVDPSEDDDLGDRYATFKFRTPGEGYDSDPGDIILDETNYEGGGAIISLSVRALFREAAEEIALATFNRDVWWEAYTQDCSRADWREYELLEAVD